MRYIVSIVFFSALTALTYAATALIDNLPPDLSARMQRSAGGAGLLLDPPAGFPVFTYPAEVVVLGSIDEPLSSTIVLGEVGLNARAQLEEVLLAAGWLNIPLDPPRNSGFIGAPGPERALFYCHDSESGRLSLDQISNQGERYFLLAHRTMSSFVRGPGEQEGCSTGIERRRRGDQARIETLGTYMPRLELPGLDDPATAPALHSSTNGGGQGDQMASARVTTTLGLAALTEHLVEQLSAQDWIMGGRVDGPYQLISSWTRQLDDGSMLLGVLNTVEIEENGFYLQFSLVQRVP